MLHRFEEFQFYAEITGFKNVNFEQVDSYLKANRKIVQQTVWIQFFNADLIATQEHLYFAILNALTAFKNQTNLSKSLAMETMLYASSQRQIQRAIQVVGVKPGMSRVAVVIIGESTELVKAALNDLSGYLKTEPCDALLDLTPIKTTQIKQAFKITAPMIEVTAKSGKENLALVALVIEQVALLATEL